ncbi:helix-turn-helix domain-containing protein [Sphingobacterium sp. HJSM2_6]|uniref:helix-turn-helix domain-containing protein n=1 Tax=Sphingobacterium sp. HJSM2_6 TaxID=3366264 RepID=UPI003BE63460
MNTIRVINEKVYQTDLSFSEPYYIILLLEDAINFSIDLQDYQILGPSCIFLSPYQHFKLNNADDLRISELGFHGDFYCIEYHKEDVACNGILFNNIYATPYVLLEQEQFVEIKSLFTRIHKIQQRNESYELSIMKASLQLILAINSKEKQLVITAKEDIQQKSAFSTFRELLESNFIKEKSIQFYADYYHTTATVFSKKIKGIYGKPASKLIKERVVLEAKKRLHLTHKNVNEIAFELGFSDEFYFSRYFKNEVGVSPKTFREKVGIAKIAK